MSDDPYLDAVLEDLPDGYWPLDDMTRTARDVVGGNPGTYEDAMGLGVPGVDRARLAVRTGVEGTPGWVQIPGAPVPVTQGTVELWVQRVYHTGWRPLVSLQNVDGGPAPLTLLIHQSNGVMQAQFGTGLPGPVAQNYWSTQTGATEAGAGPGTTPGLWHHIVLTYARQGPVRFYVNTRLVHAIDMSYQLNLANTSGQPLIIGAQLVTAGITSANANTSFWGFALYPHVLSHERVIAHFRAGRERRGVVFDQTPLVPGSPRGAVLFRGPAFGGYMVVDDAPEYRLTGDMWVMGRIRPGVTNRHQALLSKLSDGDGYELGIDARGRLYWTSGGVTATDTVTPLHPNRTYFLAVILAGDEVQFFVNGTLSSAHAAAAPTSSTVPLRFATSPAYEGEMQDWAIGAGAPWEAPPW